MTAHRIEQCCQLLSTALNDWMMIRNKYERICKDVGFMGESSYDPVEGIIVIHVSLLPTYCPN